MCTAAARGFRNAAQHLLRNGALVDGIPSPYCVGVPILRALHYNHEEMVQLLIESGADLSVHSPGTNVATVLEGTAKRSSNPQFIKKLLQDSRVDVNMVDPKGLTIVTSLSVALIEATNLNAVLLGKIRFLHWSRTSTSPPLLGGRQGL